MEKTNDKRVVLKEWNNNGRRCMIVKITPSEDRFWYCGYVQTSLEGDYETISRLVDVHGGTTYGVDSDGWVGFDTMHAFDVPVDNEGNKGISESMVSENCILWTPDNVIDETNKLAEQLDKIEKPIFKICNRINCDMRR